MFNKEKRKSGFEPLVLPGQPSGRPRTGWVSPEYVVSRRVNLDPAVLDESHCIAFFPDPPELEYFRVLRSRILRSASGRIIMVTSTYPGEGKTLTAINLALTIAREYRQTALLVDGDLKNQTVHQRLGLPADGGLADYLLEERSLQDVIVWPGVEKLTLIAGGRNIQGGAELVGSPRMKDLVGEMKARYADRYIVFDVPPVMTGADAMAFASYADHIVFVVQAGRTPKTEIMRALALLPREKILGLALNRQDRNSIRGYAGRYGNYYGSPK
jgi:non-specific protein-tyrosine kinase